jgi:hypothetical protein
VVMPQNVKKSQNHCTLAHILASGTKNYEPTSLLLEP